jgi:hypothetical protein
MGWFSPKVPDTIGSKKMKELQRKAAKANKESMFSKKNVDRRLASGKQQSKSWWS